MSEKYTRKTLREKLTERLGRELADYVVSNTSTILYMKLETFCAAAGISREQAAAVFEAFGAGNFMEFKDVLRDSLYYESGSDSIRRRSISSITDEIVRFELKNLTDLAGNMDYELLARLTQDVLAASEVLVIGARACTPYALYLTRMLLKLGIRARFFDPAGDDRCDLVSTIDPSALVIVFGMARYYRDSLVTVRMLKQRGIRVIGITDSAQSPYVMLSDYSFVMPIRSFDFSDSYSAGMAFVSVLVFSLFLEDEENMRDRLHSFDVMTEDMGIFF